MKKQKKKHSSHASPVSVKGVLEITRSGIGYVLAEDGAGDILVRPQDFNQAFNGDTVSVNVTRGAFDGRKREGRVEKVISRRQTEFIGMLQFQNGRVIFQPSGNKPMPGFELDAPLNQQVEEDQQVIVRFIEWLPRQRRPVGRLIEVLAPDARNDIAMKEILVEKGFPLVFSDDSLETAARLSDRITEEELNRRKDLREVLTFTIDPVDAKDFDDAISYQVLPNGLFEVGVHIADVSHFVEEDTPLDEEAYERATSVYLPDRVNPMLPERISNELCSLRPHEDKYTFSILFQMNEAAEVKSYWIGKTVTHSDHRYTYEDAQEIIKGGQGPYQEVIVKINELSQKLRKKRFTHGAINFSSQEVRFQLDEQGKPVGVVIKESFEAHQLIEELMLLANRYIAERVQKAGKEDKPIPFPYRIHNTPDEEKLVPFIAFARKFGYKFNLGDPDSIAASFNAMLDAARGTPQQHVLEQLGIRTMAKAIYSSENIGHYGLGFEHYCHFTSPIRRYPDVMVHRILQQVLDGTLPNDKKMEKKCKHSSERERAAMECERAANKYKQVEFMSERLGEVFDAVVTGVSSFGFWAETVAHKCEGLISIAYLNTFDDFRLVESDYQLAGLRSGRVFRMGDTVRIRVVSANLDRRQLDYEWLPGEGTGETPSEKPAKEKGRKGKKALPSGPAKQEKRKAEPMAVAPEKPQPVAIPASPEDGRKKGKKGTKAAGQQPGKAKPVIKVTPDESVAPVVPAAGTGENAADKPATAAGKTTAKKAPQAVTGSQAAQPDPQPAKKAAPKKAAVKKDGPGTEKAAKKLPAVQTAAKKPAEKKASAKEVLPAKAAKPKAVPKKNASKKNDPENAARPAKKGR